MRFKTIACWHTGRPFVRRAVAACLLCGALTSLQGAGTKVRIGLYKIPNLITVGSGWLGGDSDWPITGQMSTCGFRRAARIFSRASSLLAGMLACMTCAPAGLMRVHFARKPVHRFKSSL